MKQTYRLYILFFLFACSSSVDKKFAEVKNVELEISPIAKKSLNDLSLLLSRYIITFPYSKDLEIEHEQSVYFQFDESNRHFVFVFFLRYSSDNIIRKYKVHVPLKSISQKNFEIAFLQHSYYTNSGDVAYFPYYELTIKTDFNSPTMILRSPKKDNKFIDDEASNINIFFNKRQDAELVRQLLNSLVDNIPSKQ